MTHSKNSEKQQESPDFLKQLVQTYLSEWIPSGQEYLEQEVACHLGALPYERTQNRKDHRNVYKPRQLNTRLGKLFLSVPQTRDSSFSIELFERYQRSEKALLSGLQEMVIQGVAIRRVAKVTESLCGLDFSKSQVSAICKKLDTEIQAWLNRPLEQPSPAGPERRSSGYQRCSWRTDPGAAVKGGSESFQEGGFPSRTRCAASRSPTLA